MELTEFKPAQGIVEIKVNGDWLEINGVAIRFPSESTAQDFLIRLIKEDLI